MAYQLRIGIQRKSHVLVVIDKKLLERINLHHVASVQNGVPLLRRGPPWKSTSARALHIGVTLPSHWRPDLTCLAGVQIGLLLLAQIELVLSVANATSQCGETISLCLVEIM